MAIAQVLKDAGRYQEAISYFEQAKLSSPYDAELNWELGDCYLSIGNFKKGFEGFSYRWKYDKTFEKNLWQGEPVLNKKIMIYYQWDIINILINLRFFKLLKDQGATIIFNGPERFHILLKHCPYVDKFIDNLDFTDCDYQIPVMHLGYVFDLTFKSIPLQEKFLKVPKSKSDKLKIGLFSLDESLKKVLLNILMKHESSTTFFTDTDFPDNYEKLLYFLADLDLVITTDNFITVCSGTLAISTWMILPAVTDWFWFTDLKESPFFSTVKLFRKTKLKLVDNIYREIGVCLDIVLHTLLAKRYFDEAKDFFN